MQKIWAPLNGLGLVIINFPIIDLPINFKNINPTRIFRTYRLNSPFVAYMSALQGMGQMKQVKIGYKPK